MSRAKKLHKRRHSKPPGPLDENQGRASQPPAGKGLAGRGTLTSLTKTQEQKRRALEKVLKPAVGKELAEKASRGIVAKREDAADAILREPGNAAETVQRFASAFSGNGFNVGGVISKLYAYQYGTRGGGSVQEEKIMCAMEALEEVRATQMKGSELRGVLREAGFEVSEAEGQCRVYWNGNPVRSDNRHVMFPSKKDIGPRFVLQVLIRCQKALERAIDEL